MTLYDDQRRMLADDIYSRGGHYVLCTANVDLFGFPIIGGGYRDIRPLSHDEAVTIHLEPLQGIRHVNEKGER